MHIINPATEELITDIAEDSRQSVQDKFELLKIGQPAGLKTDIKKRIACIEKFDQLLEQHKDELARTLTSEMGKPLQQSYNELAGASKRIRYFITHSEKYLADEWVDEARIYP